MDLADNGVLDKLGERIERIPQGHEVVREGGAPGRPRFLLSGWACRQRILPDGRRQIFSFLVAGDGIGFCRLPTPRAQSSIHALTPLELADGQAVAQMARLEPDGQMAKALNAAAVLEEAQLLDGLVRLGRQTAYERLAHLLLELHRRLTVAGLAAHRRFPMPLTQEVLSDALGLSVVHLNRTLQQLRRDGMIDLRNGAATLLSPDQLEIVADYREPNPSLSRGRVV